MNIISSNQSIIFLITLFTGICFNQLVVAQVEHNYLIGPQSTNCDSLDLSTASLTDAIQTIHKTKFRFQQQFSISRATGVMKALYYSCDGENGYLIMRVDKEDMVYLEVPKKVWDELLNTPDINAFYIAKIYRQFKVISE